MKGVTEKRRWTLLEKVENIFCASRTYGVFGSVEGSTVIYSLKMGLEITLKEEDIQNMGWNSKYAFIWLHNGMEIIYHSYQDQLVLINGEKK